LPGVAVELACPLSLMGQPRFGWALALSPGRALRRLASDQPRAAVAVLRGKGVLVSRPAMRRWSALAAGVAQQQILAGGLTQCRPRPPHERHRSAGVTCRRELDEQAGLRKIEMSALKSGSGHPAPGFWTTTPIRCPKPAGNRRYLDSMRTKRRRRVFPKYLANSRVFGGISRLSVARARA